MQTISESTSLHGGRSPAPGATNSPENVFSDAQPSAGHAAVPLLRPPQPTSVCPVGACAQRSTMSWALGATPSTHGNNTAHRAHACARTAHTAHARIR